MCALFDDAAFVKDNDLVRLEDGVEAMGDGDGGAALHQFASGFFEQGFGFGIEAGGGFVEDEDGGVFEEGARKGYALGLSAGETGSAFTDDGFIFFGKRFDKFVQVRGLRGDDQFFVSRVRFADTDVGGDGVVEEVRALGNPGDGIQKAG